MSDYTLPTPKENLLFERTASKHVYYQGWNRPPAQDGCMRQVLGPCALGRPRGIGWRGRWEGGSGWGIHVNPWLIHVNVWQKPLQYCKVISLQLIKINGNKQTKKMHHVQTKKKNKNCYILLIITHRGPHWLSMFINPVNPTWEIVLCTKADGNCVGKLCEIARFS